MKKHKSCVGNKRGFTLVEVLLALAVIAIALTALLKASAQNIVNTNRIKDKTMSQWVGMQAVAMVQTGLLKPVDNRETSQVTTLFGQRWYWRVLSTKTALPSVYQLKIELSKTPAGPFRDPLIAFWYKKNAP